MAPWLNLFESVTLIHYVEISNFTLMKSAVKDQKFLQRLTVLHITQFLLKVEIYYVFQE